MKRILGILNLLASANLMAQQVPSDLKRQEIELEKGEINLHRAHLSVEAGNATSKSNQKNYSVSPYRSTDVTVKAGTKFVVGTVRPDYSTGLAIGPEAKINVRLDDSGKKMRFEVGGNLISVIDYQQVFGASDRSNALTYEDRVRWASKRLEEKKNDLAFFQKASVEVKQEIQKFYNLPMPDGDYSHFLNAWDSKKGGVDLLLDFTERRQITLNYDVRQEFIARRNKGIHKAVECKHLASSANLEARNKCQEEFKKLLNQEVEMVQKYYQEYVSVVEKNYAKEIQEEEETIKRNENYLAEEKKKTPYGTVSISFANLGGLHRELSDALYKFSGFRGSLLNVSFDIDGKIKNSDMRIGLCGIFEMLTLEAGKYEKQGKSYSAGLFGANGSLCTRVSLGQFSVTNTFKAGLNDSNLDNRPVDYSINNNARIAYQSKVIPGAITEIGAGHTYTFEKIGEAKIGTHVIGGGVTVYAK